LGANESFDPNSTQYDTLVIPKNVKTINKKAFYASSSDRSILKNIHYLKFETKSQCQEIQESAFSMAASLIGDLILPNSLVTIGSDAFLNCNFDQKITLDAKIENIGVDAFFRCKFNNITNSSHHFAFASAAGDARILIKNNVSRDFNYVSDQPVGCLATGHLIIPDNTLTIGEYAFYGCNGLTGDLEIPSSVTDVGYQAFGGCESINYDTSTFNGVAGTIRCSKGASK
jgi:hypothetical protein